MTVSAALSVTRRGLTAAALAMLAVPLAPAVASAAPATNLWISLESPGGYWGATGDQVTGEAADWWVAVMNSGPGTVDGSVTVTMPAGLQVVPTFPATVTTTPAGGTTITWQELTFSNGQQRDYHLSVTPTSAGTYTGNATVELADGTTDLQPADDSSSSTVVVEDPSADLGVTVAADPHDWRTGNFYAGTPTRWWVDLRNDSSYDVGADVTATFPAGLKPTVPTGATAAPGADGATVVTWSDIHPSAYGAGTFLVMATPMTPGSYPVTATITPSAGSPADPDLANNTATTRPTFRAWTRTLTVSTPAIAQWSDTTPVDVAVKSPYGTSTAGTPVTVKAFGRTYTATAGSDGRARVNAVVVSAPGTRTTVTASVAATSYAAAVSGSSAAVTVAGEDGQLTQLPVSGTRGRPVTVTLRMLDSTAYGYTGVRREPSATTRADVTKSVVAVKIYYGRTLIVNSARRLTNIGNGIGQTTVAFTPRSSGTYTVVTSASPGTYYNVPTLSRTVSVR
jgi:hypothetical protein